jgi:GNAT superfamily N-acetyltransferase
MDAQMMLPSLKKSTGDDGPAKPQILLLEIRARAAPKDEPIAWLLVERREDLYLDARDGTVVRASIRLDYQRIVPGGTYLSSSQGSFEGGYSRDYAENPAVSLSGANMAGGAIFLDLTGLEGQGIGTWLLNQIVVWAKRWPEASVNQIRLTEWQGYDANKERRNRFYEQFGIEFVFTDPDHRSGIALPMRAGALVPSDRWKKTIAERELPDFIAELLCRANDAVAEVARRDIEVRELRAVVRGAKSAPIRWAVRQLWHEYGEWVMIAIVAIVVGMVTVLQWSRL